MSVITEPDKKKPRVRNDIKGTGQDWRKGKTKYNAEELQSKYKDYINYCKDVTRKPTWEGFAVFIDVCSETLMNWLNAKSEDDRSYNPDVVDTLKKIQDSFVDNLLQRTDVMAVFSLKQSRYGGYADKQQIDTNSDVNISFNLGVQQPK